MEDMPVNSEQLHGLNLPTRTTSFDVHLPPSVGQNSIEQTYTHVQEQQVAVNSYDVCPGVNHRRPKVQSGDALAVAPHVPETDPLHDRTLDRPSSPPGPRSFPRVIEAWQDRRPSNHSKAVHNPISDPFIINVKFTHMTESDSITELPKLVSSSHAIRAKSTLGFADIFREENQRVKSGLLVIIIEGWTSWLSSGVRQVLPRFPLESLLHFGGEGGSAMLPLVDNTENALRKLYADISTLSSELSCVVDHIRIFNEEYNTGSIDKLIDLGVTKAHRNPLILWTRQQGRKTGSGFHPIIVMIGGVGHNLGSAIEHHYSEVGYKRWHRLEKNLAWAYIDTYFVLTKWDRVWSAIKKNVSLRSAELQGQVLSPPILQQTRRLHQETNLIISLQEHLRIHKASFKRIIRGISAKEEMIDSEQKKLLQILRVRLEDNFQLLEYYEVTACSLLDQQQNLLSLAFNTETVSQGHAVARLNALAFIFLPLSFSASIFGMTTFEVDSVWYPAFAIPLLFITTAIAVVTNKLLSNRDSRSEIQDFRSAQTRNVKPVQILKNIKWHMLNVGKWLNNLFRKRSTRGYTSGVETDPEDTPLTNLPPDDSEAIVLPKAVFSAVPYGMSPSYGLENLYSSPAPMPQDYAAREPKSKTPPAISQAPLSGPQAHKPVLPPLHHQYGTRPPGEVSLNIPIQRVNSLRSQRSFSWKKDNDDLETHDKQLSGVGPSDDLNPEIFISHPGTAEGVVGSRAEVGGTPLAVQPTGGPGHLDTIPEQKTPLSGSVASSSLLGGYTKRAKDDRGL